MGRIDRSTDRGLGVSALLLQRGGAVGRFDVQELSPSGAVLTGASDVRRSAPLRVLLELPSGEPVSVGAHVKRTRRAGGRVSLAVGFVHVSAASEDRIQDALLGQLDARHRAAHPAVVVVDRSARARGELAGQIARLGHRVITAAAPLDAIRVLEDPLESVAAIVVRGGHDARELLGYAAECHPRVRRIGYGETHDTSDAVRCATPAELAAALTPAS